MQASLPFDGQEGTRRKTAGQALRESNDSRFIALMREVAVRIARESGSVSSDDLRAYAVQHGLAPGHRNSWGCVFKGKAWRSDGFVRSELVSNHGRVVRRWVWQA